MSKLINLTGKIINRLTVLDRDFSKINEVYWFCKCECGKIVSINRHWLRKGQPKSCGCSDGHFIDLTNKRFGRLLVIKHIYNYNAKKHRRHLWECLCDCGNKTIVQGGSLSNDTTKSCGCLGEENRLKAVTKHGLCKRENFSHYGYFLYKCNKNPSTKLRRYISNIIRHKLRTNKGGQSMLKYLPYTINELRNHLESQFEPWMTWDNYGEWHIDHIKPQSKFYFTSMLDEDFQKCWALSNLRPLKAIDNLKKGAKYND